MAKRSLVIGFVLGIVFAYTMPVLLAHNEDLILALIKQIQGNQDNLNTKTQIR